MANTVLSVFNLKKTFELEPIFAGVSFQLNEGDKAALVGVNGAGKTTILEIIAGIDLPDTGGGQVVKARGLRVAYLPQEVSGFGDLVADHHLAIGTTLWDAMLDALGDIHGLQIEMHRLEQEMSEQPDRFEELMARYEAVTERFERAGGYQLEHKVEQVLEGLGFVQAQFDLAIDKLSGGQKTRAALGRALLSDPDLLLLDEPTNHLDLAAIEWLESFLIAWSGTVLCSSHDRRFLDKVTTRTLELEFGKLEDYPGNYTKYLGLKADRTELRLNEFQAQQEYIAKQQDFIRRYKNSQKSRQAKGREKRLNRLERVRAPRSNDQLKLELKAHVRSGRSVLAVEDLEVGFPAPSGSNGTHDANKLVLMHVPDLEIERSERVALIGPNGAGKTTLLRTVLGEMQPLAGEVIVGHNVKIGYYAQAHEGLDPSHQVIDEIVRTRAMSEEAARNLLGRFLFSGDDVYKRIGDLSGGERSRVALAKLTLTDANFLLLDEPTNHLDLGAREALEDVLSDYQGTLLFVSHDRAFMDSLATQIWVLADTHIEAFDGNYSDYQEELARRRREGMLLEGDRAYDARGTTVKLPSGSVPGSNGKGAGHALPPITKAQPNQQQGNQQARRDQRAREEADRAAARAAALAQRQLKDIESAIADLEARLNLLSGELEAASAAGDIALVADVGREYQSLADELEQKYSTWEVLAR